MRMAIVACATTALIGVTIPAASGAIETWSAPLTASLAGLSGSQAITCDLPTFDTHNGTRLLTGVELSGQAFFFSQARVQNLEPLLNSFNVRFGAGVTLLAPGGGLTTFETSSQNAPDLLPLEIHTFTDFAITSSLGTSHPSTALYATPTQGTITLAGSFDAGLELLGGFGNFQWATTNPSLGGFVTVEYTYQAVPTPAGASLGLLAAGLIARRRRG